MKNWHITLFLFLLIIVLTIWSLYSSKNIRKELSKKCHGDIQCVEQINNVPLEQLEQVQRETHRCNNSPQCVELYTFGAGNYVKPSQHIFIPVTHDSPNQKR
mgnify:CR=1 FL=1